MNINIRPITQEDVPNILRWWNITLPYDSIAEETFTKIIFDDLNYETNGHLVGVKNNTVIGFLAAVAREGISGRDGAGQAHKEELGYIKALFVQKGCDEEVKRNLLEKALEFLQSKGKNKARVGEYTGPYFFPGIDTKYENELRFYRENGFKEIEFEEDVSFNLISFKPTAYQDRMKKRVTEMGVVIEAYRPEYLGKMRDFVEKVNFPHWFPPGWDLEFGDRNYPLVALLENVIVGWSSFFKSPERWWFGPIAVLQEFGRKGIGTSLLLESMLQLKALEAQDVTAGWANVPFYFKSDWKITRRYIIFQKDL